MTSKIAATCVVACLFAASAARAQTAQLMPPPQNVLSLSASASVEVVKDWLAITLATTREAGDAATVQAQLRQALDAALTEARKAARSGQIEVRTGGFSIAPRYAPKGGIGGWQGSAELLLEGRDVAGLSQLAGRLQTLAVSRVGFALSREAREKVEGEVAAQAITRFRAQAEAHARQFGFAGYAIREVQVASGGDSPLPMPIARGGMVAMSAEAPLPVEAGKATVTANVSGSVQMLQMSK